MQWNITDYQEVAGQTGYATVCCSVGQIVRLWHATKAFSLSVIWSELNFPAMMPYMRSLDHFQNRPWHKSSLLVWEKLLIWTPKSPQVGKEDDNLIWSRSKSLEILYLYETCLNMYVVCLGGCWWVHMICTYDIYEHMCEHVYMCKCVYTRIMDNGRFQKLWKPCNLARPAVEVNIALFLVPACCVLFPLGRGLIQAVWDCAVFWWSLFTSSLTFLYKKSLQWLPMWWALLVSKHRRWELKDETPMLMSPSPSSTIKT